MLSRGQRIIQPDRAGSASGFDPLVFRLDPLAFRLGLLLGELGVSGEPGPCALPGTHALTALRIA